MKDAMMVFKNGQIAIIIRFTAEACIILRSLSHGWHILRCGS